MSHSGTSMATPHVAGAAAILAGQHPDWPADQLKATLTGTAKPTEGLSVFEQGAGRVDVAKATTTSVFTTPATVNYGTAQWPHDDDQPITRTVTYINTGPSRSRWTSRSMSRDRTVPPRHKGCSPSSRPS